MREETPAQPVNIHVASA